MEKLKLMEAMQKAVRESQTERSPRYILQIVGGGYLVADDEFLQKNPAGFYWPGNQNLTKYKVAYTTKLH